jgi:uncharacterized protein (DUF58 family)
MRGPGESESPRAPATAALGATFILAGLGFDLMGALLCGVALLSLAVGAVIWVELATRGGRLEREPGPRRLEEGVPYPLRIRLRRTLVPPPGGRLIEPLLERPVAVGPRWRKRLECVTWLDRPGRRRLESARLIVRDPLGLWRRELRSGPGDQIVVLPRIDRVRWRANGGQPRGSAAGSGHDGDASSRRRGVAQFEVDGLRPYREGSPASRIHWPAVARTGEMLERHLVAGGEPRPLVVFDPRGGSEPGARERAMRAAASLCAELARRGGCDLLLPGERRPLSIDSTLRAWPEAHVRIAISGEGAAPALSAASSGGAVLWVTAGSAPPPFLGRNHPGSYVVAPTGSRRSADFRVSGCFGYPISRATGSAQELARRVAG